MLRPWVSELEKNEWATEMDRIQLREEEGKIEHSWVMLLDMRALYLNKRDMLEKYISVKWRMLYL
jgi:hypothetical protein